MNKIETCLWYIKGTNHKKSGRWYDYNYIKYLNGKGSDEIELNVCNRMII